MPKIVDEKVIAGDTASARLTLLKKLPVLDGKPSLNHPDYSDLSYYEEYLAQSRLDRLDNLQNQNYESIDYSAEGNLFSIP